MRIGIHLLSLKPGQVGGQEVLLRRLIAHMIRQLGDDQLVLFARPELVADPEWQGVARPDRGAAERHNAATPSGRAAAAQVEWIIEDPQAHYDPRPVRGPAATHDDPGSVRGPAATNDDPGSARGPAAMRNAYADWTLDLLQRAKLDAVFYPLFFFFPRPLPIPVAVGVPDLQHEFFPEYFSDEQLAWRRERIGESVALADAVITLSQFSKRTICDRLAADPAKVHAIYPGGFIRTHHASGGPSAAGRDACPTDANSSFAIRYSPFLLYPAADWPHKNHETLLQAVALLAERGRPEHLVLTGMLSQRGDTLRSLAADLGIADRVHFLGCVSQDELIALYRGARLMAFPSRFEGFGLPLVEAMQCGCPIVASKVDAVIEVAGDAAVYCEDDAADWAARLASVLANDALRTDLIHRGRARAVEFEWDACAARHLDLLRHLGRFKDASGLAPELAAKHCET